MSYDDEDDLLEVQDLAWDDLQDLRQKVDALTVLVQSVLDDPYLKACGRHKILLAKVGVTLKEIG